MTWSTLFWEQDFKSIKYYAIEDLRDESTGPSLEEKLQSGTTGEGSGGATPDSVSLKDLEQPNAHLPSDACRLKEEEFEALRAELVNQESEPLGTLVVELAIELTLQERRREERERIVESMVAIADRLLKDGELGEVARMCEHLEGLADMLLAKSEAVGHLREKVFRALSEAERLGNFLEQVEQSRALKPSELTTFLARLGSDALRSLIPAMARMTMSPYRRAVADAILAKKEEAATELGRHIPSNGDIPDTTFVRELVYILSHLPEDQALPLAEQLLEAPDETIRREATAVLGRFRGTRSGEICLRQALDFIRESISNLDSPAQLNLRQAKRTVQKLVDLSFEEGEGFSLAGMASIKDHDNYTFNHMVNVSVLAIAFGQRLGLKRQDLAQLGLCALYHDMGKLHIPLEVLNKKGSLSEEEWAIMGNHTVYAARTLFPLIADDPGTLHRILTALQHHVGYDGKGYPDLKLRTRQGLFTRIVSITDTFDAMTTKRIYQRQFLPSEALAIIQKAAGTRYDPLLVKAFINCMGVFPIGSTVLVTTGELGVVVESNPDPDRAHQPKVKVVTDAKRSLTEPQLVDLSHHSQANRAIVKCVDPEVFGINSAHYVV